MWISRRLLSLCYSWEDLSIPCASVCFLGSTQRVHKGFSTGYSDTSQQRDQSPCISQRLDHPCRFPRRESSAYATDYPVFTNLGMDFQLQEAYTGTLTHTRLLGAALQSRTSNCFSSRLFLDSHQCPFPSISVQAHACMQDNLYKQSDLSLCPGYPSRTPSSQVPTVLDKKTLVITQPWDTQIQLHSEFLTHLRCFNRREVLQGVPLHVPEPTLFFFPDASLAGWGTRWQTQVISQVSGHLPIPPNVSSGWNWKRYDWPYFSGTSVAQQTVRVYCENSTAVAYFRKQGGTHSISLLNNTLELFHLLHQFAFLLFPTHLPRMWQRIPCLESTVPVLQNGGFPRKPYTICFLSYGPPIADRFATVENKVTPVCVSHHPDKITWAVDALSISWVGLGLVYTFPPVPQISPFGSNRVVLFRVLLRQHHFTETVVELAADPFRDSSSNLYNSQWQNFAKWANDKGIQSKDSHMSLWRNISFICSRRTNKWTPLKSTEPPSLVSLRG